MALSYRATPAVTTWASGTSHTITKQAGTVAGDWVFIYCYNISSSLACTGFSVVRDPNTFGGLLYRCADGSEGSSFSVTGFSSNGFPNAALIATVAGAAATLDPATVSTPASGGPSTNLTAASITLTGSGDWVLWFGADQATGFTGNGQAITAPGGFSSQASNGAQTGRATLMLADDQTVSPGATGTKTGTVGTAAYYSCVLVGLTPAAPAYTVDAGAAGGTGAAPGPTVTAVVGAAPAPPAAAGTGAAAGPFASAVNPGSPDALPGYGTGTAPAPAPAPGYSMHPAAPPGAGTAPAGAISYAAAARPPAAEGTGAAPAPAGQFTIYMGASGGWGRPTPLPGGSQVAVAPPGGTRWTYLGELGHVTGLKYSFVMPGGADKMTCTLKLPASLRTQALNPGWQVRITRGAHVVWAGRMDEPQPGADGWAITAAGTGQRANDFKATWSSWPSGQPDGIVNAAISRGLPWAASAVGQPSWAYLGQAPDSGSTSVAQALTGICSRGTGTWYADPQPDGVSRLRLLQLPTAVDRLLVVTTPVGRTLAADINRLIIRYQSSADNTDTGAVAAYGTVTVTNQASIDAHGATEDFADLSDAGVMTSNAATALGNSILAAYQRASYAGPFTAAPGQLLNVGGQPVDPGADQAGHVVRLIISDFAAGGEVVPWQPVTFLVADYSWDDQHQVAELTPWQTANQSISALAQLTTGR